LVLQVGVTLLALIAGLGVFAAERVRESALAGTWYPGEPEALSGYVDGLLDQATATPEPPADPIRALILPHAGYQYSGATAAAGIRLVRGREFRRVIVMAPSHRGRFHGLSIADVDAYETPLGPVPLDSEAIGRLRESPLVSADPEAHGEEHAVEIELPLLQRALSPGWRLVPVLVGELGESDYGAAAELIRPLADAETLVVVSSDFTHYGPRFGYLPFPPWANVAEDIRGLDEGALSAIGARDAARFLDYQQETGITICGFRPIAILLHMLPETAKVQQIAYAASGGITGEWLNSVSYAALAVTSPEPLGLGALPAPSSPAEPGAVQSNLTVRDRELLHRLAVAGVTWAVLGEDVNGNGELDQLVDGLSPSLKQPAGAFVTLKKNGELRGCIGFIEPRNPLYEAVFRNGVNAAVADRRFLPVSPEELPALDVEVSVLTEPKSIASHEDFRVGEEGVILRKDGRQAVFLPEVATEQGWDREQTLTHLARKAGLPPDAWKNGARLEVFRSEKFSAPYPGAEAGGSNGSAPVVTGSPVAAD